MKQRLPTLVVAAWLTAAISGGNLVLADWLCVVRGDFRTPSTRTETTLTFRCSEVVFEQVRSDLVRFPPGEPKTRADALEYSKALARVQGEDRDATTMRAVLGRLSRGGAALFWLVCAAPLFGLIALLWRTASPALRHGLLVLGAVVPLAALEYFLAAVYSYRDFVGFDPGSGDLAVTTHATFATWAARVAWDLLAIAATVSWWRAPKPQRVTPVDPGVFE